jgi:hypothetical protein
VPEIYLPKLDEQISTLQQKLSQLKLRQQRLDARKRAIDSLRERKAETRRKILLGGLILEKLRQGAMDRNLIQAWLAESLTREADRALFDLPAAADPQTAAPANVRHPMAGSDGAPG